MESRAVRILASFFPDSPSTCQAKVALHIPKYRYGSVTPAILRLSFSLVRRLSRLLTFQAVVCGVKSEPCG